MIVVKKNILLLLLLHLLTDSYAILADDDRTKMQKKLNDQVLNKPFYVLEDVAQNNSTIENTEETRPSRSKKHDTYYRYWYNGYYYPYPYSYYGFPRFWYK